MEETLQLILQKITSMDSKINSMESKMGSIESRMDSLEKGQNELKSELAETKSEVQSVKSIQLRMEHTMTEKFGALFDAREVSKNTDERIEKKIDTIHNELSNVEKVTIRNAADIIDLKSYRKEN